jgi:D-glycero-D-manno-heptose 1,7-bisphosphate phosphatase
VRRAVFLDRDGVLNEVFMRNGLPESPPTVHELRVYPDVPDCLHRLRSAGFALVMTTNQPNVARGIQTRETVDAMNNHLAMTLQLDEVRVCYHDDIDSCACRKPKPGLLTAAPYYDLANSYMVGDRWRDVDAGRAAGCSTIWIDRGYSERRPTADRVVMHFAEATDWMLDPSRFSTK